MKVVALVALAFVFTACQTTPPQSYVRDVKNMPNQGGVIALNTDHSEEDRAKADMMMQKTCGNLPVKIKEEGEVAGIVDASNTTAMTKTTANFKEWKITYDCGKSKIKR
jgi:hypothetical protein